MGMRISVDIYRVMMYVMLLSMEKHGILKADLPDESGWLKNAWEWLENVRKGVNCRFAVSHLTHDKGDLNPLNMCIELNTDNVSRNNCNSRCRCECGMKPMCLKHCADKICYPCSGGRVDGISDGYPNQRIFSYIPLTPEKRNEDIFMRFLSKVRV